MSSLILQIEIRNRLNAGAFSSANSVSWEPPGPPRNLKKSAGNLGKLRGTSKEPLKPPGKLRGTTGESPGNLRGTSGNLRRTSGDLRGTSGETPGQFWGASAIFLQKSQIRPNFVPSAVFAFSFFSVTFFFGGFCAGQCARCVWALFQVPGTGTQK